MARVAALDISSTRRKRLIPPAELHLSRQKLEVPQRLHQSHTMDQSFWFMPILVREDMRPILVQMGTREADNLKIRAIVNIMEALTVLGEREVVEAPALVKTSGSTSLQHGVCHQELGDGEFSTHPGPRTHDFQQ